MEMGVAARLRITAGSCGLRAAGSRVLLSRRFARLGCPVRDLISGVAMIFGLDGFTLFHILLSLVAIASGFVVVGGFLSNARLDGATHVFLATTVLTNVTGFGFPFVALLPSHIVAIVSLVVLAVAIHARYFTGLSGVWRPIYVISATLALYLNVFVLIVQTFIKNPALAALAPTQSELPFAATQGAVLVLFALVGWLAARRFHAVRAA